MERASGGGISPRGRGGLGVLGAGGHDVGNEVSKFAWN